MEHFDWVMGAVFPYINFAIFAFLCLKFFKKPLNNMAEKRRTDYEALFAAAKSARDEAEKQSAAIEARMKNLDSEIAAITQAAQKASEKEAEASIESSRRLAQHIQEEARRVADTEIQNAKTALQNEIITAVSNSVTEKFKAELDADAHASLLNKRVGSLQSVSLGGLN